MLVESQPVCTKSNQVSLFYPTKVYPQVNPPIQNLSNHVQNCPSMTDECQYTFATNYFMNQWAGARLPPRGQIIVQAAPASELILYIGPHLTPG